MENTFEHNIYYQHSHFFSAFSNAVKSLKERDGLNNYRKLELAEVQGLYDALTECKDYYTATLKDKANITFRAIPCNSRPKSKFDLIAQNFGGDKHIIHCADKVETFALLSVGFERCKHYLSLFLDRYYLFLHKTTFFDGMDFIDAWDENKKRVFIGVWFAIVWRDKNQDFETLWEEFIKELDRLAFVPEVKIREVEKQREVKTQKKVKEKYTERVFVGIETDVKFGYRGETKMFSSWDDYKRNGGLNDGKRAPYQNPREVYKSVIKEREVIKEVVELETYIDTEEYLEEYSRDKNLMELLANQTKKLNISLKDYNAQNTLQGENNANN